LNKKLVFYGRIHAEMESRKRFTAYCGGGCQKSLVVSRMGELENYRQAEKKLRDHHEEFGWARIPGLGWCCPQCVFTLHAQKAVME